VGADNRYPRFYLAEPFAVTGLSFGGTEACG
jgi:hypothetical protein